MVRILSLALSLLFCVSHLPGCQLLRNITNASTPAVLANGAISYDQIQQDRTLQETLEDQFSRPGGHYSHSQIKVFVHNGSVLLVGKVQSTQQKVNAGALVKKVAAVRILHNQLKIKPGYKRNRTQSELDSKMVRKIKTQFSLSKNVPMNKMTVGVVDNELILMGLLTQAEIRSTMETAQKLSGISRIIKAFEQID